MSELRRRMKLSELKTGERGVIVKVSGHGGFRKRIIEMGFIKGKTIEVLLNAPLHDPVKYRVMGYEVSLRRSEAEQIEIVPLNADEEERASKDDAGITSFSTSPTRKGETDENVKTTDSDDVEASSHYRRQRRTINVALVGNPNCGKTSLFNYASGAHERVGNYAGVTVDAKEGTASFEGYTFRIVDLPGTYSLSPYSPEELYVRKQLIDHTPDVVINVIDASNLERNLFLTTQLIDMNLKMVCALNMFDETRRRGDHIDCDKLATLLGIPMIPTVFTNGTGVDTLFHVIINIYEGADYVDAEGVLNPEVAREISDWHQEWHPESDVDHPEDFAHGAPRNNVLRHLHINHGSYIERAISAVQRPLKGIPELRQRFSTRYLAIKLLERDKAIEHVLNDYPGTSAAFKVRDAEAATIQQETGEDSETAIMDAKYAFIRGALQEAAFSTGDRYDNYATTHAIDALLTNRYLSFPLFFLFLFFVFHITFTVGQYPMDWIDSGVTWLSDFLTRVLPAGPVRDMIVDGAVAGVGAVIVFLPQILILYTFISFMEDTGYMARAAFIMDRFMHTMGIHGKSFIPLLMAFGCNVPAVLSTRTIESPRSRLVTILIIPFMSCSARLPIYLIITAAFFPRSWQSLVMIGLYVLGILLAILVSPLLSKWLVGGQDAPFVMELPPYRMPTAKAIARHTWNKGSQYLRKMGGTILVASIIVWALSYFPHNDSLTTREQQEQSYIAQVAKAIEPVFAPQHFSWKLDATLVAALPAKEILASTVGVLYDAPSASEPTAIPEEKEQDPAETTESYSTLRASLEADGVTTPVALAYLVFILLYMPCIATLAAIRAETLSWKWTFFAAAYTTAIAWVLSALTYQAAILVENLIG